MYLVNDSKSIYVSLGNGDVCLGLNMAITGKSLSTKGHTTVKPKKPQFLCHYCYRYSYRPLEETGS